MSENSNNHTNELDISPEQGGIVGSLIDSKTSQLDDVLNEKLEHAFHKQTSQVFLHSVAKIASEHDPIDLAYAVSRLPPSARVVVYENLPDFNAKIIFMTNTSSNTRAAIFRQIDNKEIKSILEGIPPDEAVWLLDDMSDRRMKRVLDVLEPKKCYRILELQKHERHSAGRLMTNEFFAFHMNNTIGEVSSYIRDNPGIELTRSIFVLNPEGELIGFVPDRNLIINAGDLPLRQVMRPALHSVGPDTSRDEVVDIVERYKIAALPVVDDNNHMVGVITYEDVVEAMEDIADETIASIGGTGEHFGEREPLSRRLAWRSPWLLVTLCAGLITATAMSHFSDRIWFAFVPFFVPLITGMSGNVGIQCSTVLVRGISTGEMSPGTKNEAIRRELLIGLVIGLVFGVACGIGVYGLNQLGIGQLGSNPFILGLTITFGVFGACMTATFLGSFSPFFFARLGVDPAVASGPIVTAFNDVISTLMFFVVAWLVNSFFGWGMGAIT